MNEPKAGNLVRDEHGRIIMSYSSLTQFRGCQRKYKYRYIDHIIPLMLEAGDPRNVGSSHHGALEALRDGENVDDEIVRYWGLIGGAMHDRFEERERVRAAMRAYRQRWMSDGRQADFHWELVALEGRFTGDIIDPLTGRVHQEFSIGGKIDLGVRVLEPCLWGSTEIEPGLYLGEAKSWAKIDGDNLKRLWTDFQILLYSHYFQDAMQEEVRGVLYDVIGKAKSVGHTEAETQGEFDQRVKELRVMAEAGELGTRLKQKQGKPGESDAEFEARKSEAKQPGRLKRRTSVEGESDEDFKKRRIKSGREQVGELEPIQRESDESFCERLDQAYANKNKFHREVVPIDPKQVERIRLNIWDTLAQHSEAESRAFWGQNEFACFDFYRACDYFGICKSLDNPNYIDENYRLKTPHSEQDVNPHLPIIQ